MTGRFIDKETDPLEWERAWSALYALLKAEGLTDHAPGEAAEGCDQCNPLNGECWQYMGTEEFRGVECSHVAEQVHVFRHRSHPRFPVSDGRLYRRIIASKLLTGPEV